MTTINLSKEDLRIIIKESIHEALKEERAMLIESLIPRVSNKELLEIKKLYNDPTAFDESKFQDMSDWILK